MAGRNMRTRYLRDLVLANRDMTDVTFATAEEIGSAVGLMKAVDDAVKDYRGKNDFTKWRRIIEDIVTVAHDHGVDIDPQTLRELKQPR